MDAWFQNSGFAVNRSSNAFKSLANSAQVERNGGHHWTDTTLRLDPPAYNSICSKGMKRKRSSIDESIVLEVESSLSLGVGRSSSSSDSKGSSATACTTISSAKETDEESTIDLDLDFTLRLGNEKILSPEKSFSNVNTLGRQSAVDLKLSLSTAAAESGLTTSYTHSTSLQSLDAPVSGSRAVFVDEVSTLPCKKSEFLPRKCDAAPNVETSFLSGQTPRIFDPLPVIPGLSSSRITVSKSSVTCTSGITQSQQQRNSNSKICQFNGCGKGARGASGLCIAHGGGRRCQKSGCHKGAEGRTVYCKAHGGGRRCEHLGCTKSAEGRTDYCIAHGGGRRCSHDGCTRAARGKSGLCIRHGGGKRCLREDCTKSAEGLSGLCISHGGGRRCQFPACTKGAQGSTMFCKAHGGGKRCTFHGCTKGAEGSTAFCKGHGGGKRCSFQGGGICSKSVHGGTQFCVAHGGGKRCAMPDCTKSARGRTDYCVRHGGGKRCKVDGCSKSAQGSTDFCKAHGGGKRCSWGHFGSGFGSQDDDPCSSFARGKTGLCASHNALVQDKRVHGGATIGPVLCPQLSGPEKMKEVLTPDDMNVDTSSMGGMPPSWTTCDLNHYGLQLVPLPSGEGGPSSAPAAAPEGRVHGGSLLAMLAGGSSASSGIRSMTGRSSEPRDSFVLPQRWM